MRLLVLSLVAASALARCEYTPPPIPDEPLKPLPGAALDAPADLLGTPVWLLDGWIYFSNASKNTVWRTKPDGKAEQVRPPDLEGCRLTRYDKLNRLPDGRLGMQRRCMTEDVRNDYYDQVAFDPAKGTVEKLARTADKPLHTVDWAPGLKKGYATVVSDGCPGIARLTEAGAQPFGEPVAFDGVSWPLETAYFEKGEYSCDRYGSAMFPRLLPDGKTLLLIASPQQLGKKGANRSSQPWSLYRWQPGVGAPARIAGPFKEGLPHFDLSADGRTAVMSLRQDLDGVISRYDLATGKLTDLGRGHVFAVTISPDGKQVAAIVAPYLGSERDQANAAVNRMQLRLLNVEPQ